MSKKVLSKLLKKYTMAFQHVEEKMILISAHHDGLTRDLTKFHWSDAHFTYLLLVFIRNENFLRLFFVWVSVQRFTTLNAVDFCKSGEEE